MKLGCLRVLTPNLAEAERFCRDGLDLALIDRSMNQLIFDVEGGNVHEIMERRPPA